MAFTPSIFRRRSGLSLLELVVVIAVVSVLSGGSIVLYQNFTGQQTQAQVESALDTIATGQVAYLQNNPTKSYTDITASSLITPYLPGQAIPAVLTGYTLNIAVSPPTATLNSRTYSAHQ